MFACVHSPRIVGDATVKCSVCGTHDLCARLLPRAEVQLVAWVRQFLHKCLRRQRQTKISTQRSSLPVTRAATSTCAHPWRLCSLLHEFLTHFNLPPTLARPAGLETNSWSRARNARKRASLRAVRKPASRGVTRKASRGAAARALARHLGQHKRQARHLSRHRVPPGDIPGPKMMGGLCNRTWTCSKVTRDSCSIPQRWWQTWTGKSSCERSFPRKLTVGGREK